MAYEVKLDSFEGPLDLLLHLIKKNEMDIYDIPIARITAQYLETLETMKALNLEVAGEFLVMASTLLHIKSRLLLPQVDEEEAEEEEEDPRAELVRRLLEYQKYKEAAAVLDRYPRVGRDTFVRSFALPEDAADDPPGFAEVGVYELAEALQGLLREAPAEAFHEVDVERLSVTDRINVILQLLSERESLAFGELFSQRPDRHEVIVTFLALLELGKMSTVRFMQNVRYGTIWIYPAVVGEDLSEMELEEDALGYA